MEMVLCLLSLSPQSPVNQEAGLEAEDSLKRLPLKTSQVDNISSVYLKKKTLEDSFPLGLFSVIA